MQPMTDSQVTELLNHLSHRGAVLQCLKQEIYDSHEIAAEIGKSKSSVDRDIRLLKDSDFICENVEDICITQYGAYALQVYQSANDIGRAEGFIPYLPQSAPFSLLQDAELRETSGPRPQRPNEHVTNLISEARKVNMIAPAVIPPITDILAERNRNDFPTVDIIMSEAVLDELWVSHSEELHSCLETGACSLWQTDEQLSFGLVIVDEISLCLSVYDDSMRLIGTITNASEDALEWAWEMFRQLRDASNEVIPGGGIQPSSQSSDA